MKKKRNRLPANVGRPVPAVRANMVPARSPAAELVLAPMPAADLVPVPSPAEEFVPAPSPAEEFVPAPSPAEEFVPAPSPAEDPVPASLPEDLTVAQVDELGKSEKVLSRWADEEDETPEEGHANPVALERTVSVVSAPTPCRTSQHRRPSLSLQLTLSLLGMQKQSSSLQLWLAC